MDHLKDVCNVAWDSYRVKSTLLCVRVLARSVTLGFFKRKNGGSSCLVHLSCPVHGSPSNQRLLSSLACTNTRSSTVMTVVTLLSNVTTFTRPQLLCLSHLYNYMVFYLYKQPGFSGEDIHRAFSQPVLCVFFHWMVSGINQHRKTYYKSCIIPVLDHEVAV